MSAAAPAAASASARDAALLEVSDLVVGYGATKVLKRISLTLAPGEAVAVLGANGAGKTTLMNTIAGLVAPWEGSVRLEGRDLSRVAADERAALGIALAPEGRGIFTSLTIEENLLMGATCLRRRLGAAEARSRARDGLERVYAMFEVLGRRRGDRGGNLSGGQQQMLAIGRALMAEPKLLLLDEPCLGLAPKVGNEVYDILARLREGGQSLIVVEESSRRALEFVDRAVIVKLGEKALDAAAATLGGDDVLLQAYFGIEHSGHPEGNERR